jgi:DNA primase
MAFVDFAAVKAAVSIEDAAALLGLELASAGSQLRGACPRCQRAGDRALVITPAKGLFACFGADRKCGGDQLALVAHIAGLSVRDAAEWLAGTVTSEPEQVTSKQLLVSKKQASPTAPQKREGGTAPAQPAPAFDPQAFAAKLTFTEEVAALGFSEEDAEHFQVGFYRGKVYAPLRHPDGSIACFYDYGNGTLKLPARTRWLEAAAPNVVRFPRSA